MATVSFSPSLAYPSSATALPIATVVQSRRLLSFLNGIESIVSGCRKIAAAISGGLVLLLLIILALPLMLLAWIGILAVLQYWIFQQHRVAPKPTMPPNASPQDYAQFRSEYDTITELLTEMREVLALMSLKQGKDVSDTSWIIRPHARSMWKMAIMIEQAHNAMQQELQKLDDNPTSELFQPASEADLWQQRNPAYTYLV